MPTRDSRSGAELLFDTSAAISLVSRASSTHGAVAERARGLRRGLAGHALFETYSVLTRLPGTQRLSAANSARLIRENFPASVSLEGQHAAEALTALLDAGIAGGAVYDGLVGLAARAAGVKLLSCDQRARETYLALGVDVDLI